MTKDFVPSFPGMRPVVAFAAGKGYEITPDDVATYLQGQTEHDLSDEQLDSIAGGKGHHHNSVTQVATAQTVAMATTEAIAAETTVNVGAEVEVAAVAVIVAT
ncbi:MAG: hypothetical protein HN821_03600 [Rhodospirillaceae bacterium]|nr:hypothetical protein [Rhodospirillaceae bacterium]